MKTNLSTEHCKNRTIERVIVNDDTIKLIFADGTSAVIVAQLVKSPSRWWDDSAEISAWFDDGKDGQQ